MEQEKNLKEEIVAAVDGSLRSFKAEIVEVMDGRLDTFGKEANGRFGTLKKEIRDLDAKMDAGFRGQGVLMEKMQGDIDTLVEWQDLLHDRIDRLDGRMGRVEEKLDILWITSSPN